jgi:Mrp family chromosome partitioning ATPase
MELVDRVGSHSFSREGGNPRGDAQGPVRPASPPPPPPPPTAAPTDTEAYSHFKSIRLNEARLESRRIISFDATDQRCKPFDILRTQLLQSMDAKSWQVLAVTSPTAGCGKTLTAINLAISIARQPERSVLLVDLDLRNPQVARRLGLPCEAGVLGVLDGEVSLSEALVRAHIGRYDFLLLPAEGAATDSSERIASRAMRALMQELRSDFHSRTVILDLPPLLLSDDVIAVLPQVDCALLVTAVGSTTVAEVEECNRYLQATNVARVVVNKVPEWNRKYY